MTSKEATNGPTVKQLRGQISALARENKMLNHKMDLLEQNSTLKQNEILSSFLTWMEDTGAKSKEESHRLEKYLKSPTKPLSVTVKQEPISSAAPNRSVDRDEVTALCTGSTKSRPAGVRNSSESQNGNAKFDVSSKKEGLSDAGLGQSWNDARLKGSPGIMDNHSKVKSSRSRRDSNDFIPSTPVRSPFYPNRDTESIGTPSYKGTNIWYGYDFYDNASPRYLDESATADNSNVYWSTRQDDRDHTQLRSTPMTSTPKKVDVRRADEQMDLEDKVRNLLDETRLAASPDMNNFADDTAHNVASRPVTSTPAKTPQKRVVFADEIQANTSRHLGDAVSSVPRAYNCDPLNLFTPGKTPVSASRQLSYQVEFCSPADDGGLVDSRDEQSFRRLTLNDKSDSCPRRRSGASKRPTSSRKDYRRDGNSRVRNISKDKGYRSKSVRENYSAKRDLPIDVDEKGSHRPSVNVDKLFDSRENGFLNHKTVMNTDNQANYHDNQASFVGGSRSKRSRYEGVTSTTPEMTSTSKSPFKMKSKRPQSAVNVQSDISNDDATIEILENELQDIYKQNLNDEVKITEIRRNAVRRFDGWRDAMESEMSKLEKGGRDRLVKNLDKLSQSLPACLKCNCSTGFDGNSMSVDISEGRLSELADGSGLRLDDLEESRGETFNQSATEASLQTKSAPKNLGRERIRSINYQTASPSTSFMGSPDSMIFGEIAFQLERVVLSRVFRGGSKQLTGYTLSNMEKMIQSHYDYDETPMMTRQLDEVKVELHICGWNHGFHPKLVAHLIKKFGTFPTNVKAKSAARKRGWMEPQALKEEVLWRIPKKYIHDMIIILDCLFFLSKKYNIPLFTW